MQRRFSINNILLQYGRYLLYLRNRKVQIYVHSTPKIEMALCHGHYCPKMLCGYEHPSLKLEIYACKIACCNYAKGAFTLRAVRRSKAGPVCAPSAPHGAVRRRTAPHGAESLCCKSCIMRAATRRTAPYGAVLRQFLLL